MNFITHEFFYLFIVNIISYKLIYQLTCFFVNYEYCTFFHVVHQLPFLYTYYNIVKNTLKIVGVFRNRLLFIYILLVLWKRLQNYLTLVIFRKFFQLYFYIFIFRKYLQLYFYNCIFTFYFQKTVTNFCYESASDNMIHW